MSFEKISIDPRCLRILKTQRITEPTPVQAEAIPAALHGRDVVAIAQTGTGKTLAFGLPSLTRLANMKRGRNRMLVLTPTRELARQVNSVLEPYGKALKMRTVCIYGGANMRPQTQALRRGVDIIVATPGRLLDHMSQGNISFKDLSILVLDEADRMLDMGFLPDIKRIMAKLPGERQTHMFSATFPQEIARMTKNMQHDPIRIKIGAVSPVNAVRQGVYTVQPPDKIGLLSQILEDPKVQSALVFLRTKYRTDRIAKALSKTGVKAQCIHGGRSQRQRDQAIEGFRKGRYKVLVATDVAARGIDVQGITHVVNFDIPGSADDYIHRIGRTARANASGDAITFVSPEDHKALGTIERALGTSIPQHDWEGAVPIVSSFKSAKKRAPKHTPKNASKKSRRRNNHRGRRLAKAS